MKRVGLIGVVLLLGLWLPGQATCAQSIPPGGAGKARLPKAGPPLRPPGSLAARLYRATPEQRERILETLLPRQQERLRRELARFDSLPEEERQRYLEQTELLNSMTLQQRRAFAQQVRRVEELPPLRRVAVRNVLRRLQMAGDQERAAFLAGNAFRNRFTVQEQQIIRDLTALMPSPAKE